MSERSNDIRIKTTLDALIREEQELTWSCHKRLGQVALLGTHSVALLNTFVASVSGQQPTAAALMLSIQKAATLSFLSIIRKHVAQSHLNLRLAIEYTSLCAYILAHPETEFVKEGGDEKDNLVPFSKINEKAYKWLARETPENSAFLKERKDRINDTLSHANIYGSQFTFDWSGSEDDIFQGSFFDLTDVKMEKTFMLFHVQTIIMIVNTLVEMAERFGGFSIQAMSRQMLVELADLTDQLSRSILAEA